LLTQVFGGKGKVFRVGGDEFSVLIDTQKASDCSVLLQRFKALVAHTNESRVPPISIASGYACIDPANNISLAKAFHLADDAMYRDKMEQKQKLRQ
jgi:diguanylate cyclase (GGDEF)-like protein